MNIEALFRWPKLDDPDRDRAAKLLFGLLWLTIALFVLLGAGTFLLQPGNILRAFTPTLIVIALSSTCFLLLKQNSLTFASLLFVFQLWLVVTISAITGGGMETPAVQGYILVVLAAGLLIGWRTGLVTGLICVATQLVITYAEVNNLLPPNLGVRTPLTYFIVYTLISCLVILFVYYYTLSIKTALALAKRELTERKQAELELKTVHVQLRERLKELNMLHQVAQILQTEYDATLDALEVIVPVLPAGWQYPDITEARTTFGKTEFLTPGFRITPWMQRADFRTIDGGVGTLEIAYLEEKPDEAEGPFLAEERNLIRTLAEMFQTYMSRCEAEAHIQRQLVHITSLHDIDSAILTSTNLQFTLDVVIGHVLTQLKADAAAFFLLNSHIAAMEFTAGRGFHLSAIQLARQRIGDAYAGEVAYRRQLVHIPDIANVAFKSPRTQLLQDEGFVTYWGVPLIAKGEVKGVLEVFHRRALQSDTEWQDFLTALSGQAAVAIDNLGLFHKLNRRNLELALAYDVTLEGWSKALDLRDKETEGHTQRVTEMTMRLARIIGFSDKELAYVRQGALLHDVGKLGIPDNILLKPGALTDEEWIIMRKHPVYAYEWLSPIAYLQPALDIPYCHHEKWDGSGYPRGLSGTSIPLAARIFAIVDVYDALTSDRPYRKAWTQEKVAGHIREQSRKHFDPAVAEAFLRSMTELAQPQPSIQV
jgi:HD-GYP domain-containing protein (c-di-GMP phosphodiesterase class II)